jgi:hypothetical protein
LRSLTFLNDDSSLPAKRDNTSKKKGSRRSISEQMKLETYPADDIFVVTQMSFAVVAAIDAARVEVDVVSKTHFVSVSVLCRLSAVNWCGS